MDQPKVTHSKFKPIQAAREGRHTTVWGEYIVTHVGARTFCVLEKPKEGARLEPNSGFGHPGDRGFSTLAERQKAADDNFAPVPFP